MSPRIPRTSSAVLFAFGAISAAATKAEDGTVKMKNAYSVVETIDRLKKDIAVVELLGSIVPMRVMASAIALKTSAVVLPTVEICVTAH